MRLGFEVEFTGISTLDVAGLLSEYFDSEIKPYPTDVDGVVRVGYEIEDDFGHCWCVVEDRSINSDNCELDHCCELVTPVLEEYDDLYDILTMIRSRGGVVNDTCGIHIHIDKPSNSELFRMISEFFNIQDEVVQEFKIHRYRVEKYCKIYPYWFVKEFLNKFDNDSNEGDMLEYFYSQLGDSTLKKNALRNHILNVDSIIEKGTVEFRMFNSTLDEDTLAGYIGWVEEFISGL